MQVLIGGWHRGAGWAALVVIGLLLARGARAAEEPGGAGAEPPLAARSAADLYELGMAHYRARGFVEAGRAFEAAHALEARPEFLFALAQATRMSGDCERAVGFYRQFLATRPPARQVEATRIALARCEGDSAPATGAAPRIPGPLSPAPRPASTSPETGPLARPGPPAAQLSAPAGPRQTWYRDPVAGALAGAAVLSLGAGIGLLVASRLADEAHRGALDYSRAQERRAAAESRQRWGLVALGTGAALALGAGGRWWWVRWSGGRAGGGATVAVKGNF